MKKGDIITAVIAFVLIVLMFGAMGGVDSERLSLGQGMAAVCGLLALLVADIKLGDALRARQAKHLRIKERKSGADERKSGADEMKKGA